MEAVKGEAPCKPRDKVRPGQSVHRPLFVQGLFDMKALDIVSITSAGLCRGLPPTAGGGSLES